MCFSAFDRRKYPYWENVNISPNIKMILPNEFFLLNIFFTLPNIATKNNHIKQISSTLVSQFSTKNGQNTKSHF